MRDDRERLLDIRDAIANIERYSRLGSDVFDRDELIQNWVLRHIQIIGEAVRELSADFRQHHPDMPWSRMIGTRNILVHRYFGIDLNVVWNAVEQDLPDLKAAIMQYLAEMDADSEST